jgi:hypothetical protein
MNPALTPFCFYLEKSGHRYLQIYLKGVGALLMILSFTQPNILSFLAAQHIFNYYLTALAQLP